MSAAQKPPGGLHLVVLNDIGRAIVNGSLETGSVLNVDELCERFGVSRTVIREALRTLESIGLVVARSTVGTKVQPSSEWNLLNARVIAWRGLSDYRAQMVEILEVRRGIEGSAARLSAERADAATRATLVALATRLESAFLAEDGDSFLTVDAEFHRLLLESTRNGIMAQFAHTVSAALATRHDTDRPMIVETTPEGVRLHVALAQAISTGDAEAAEAAAIAIADLTRSEFG